MNPSVGNADLERARIRLARASDAWLTAEEAFEAAKKEYHDAFGDLGLLALDSEHIDGLVVPHAGRSF